MKYFLLSIVLILTQQSLAQKSETLIVKTDDVILQGSVALGANPKLFVGQTYFFTMIANDKNWDLKIGSKNLNVVLDEESKKSTGGLTFAVTPLDTGDCNVVLYINNDQGRQICLLSVTYRASKYPMPPVFIGGIRSGEVIHELSPTAKLSCMYGPESGIFKGYGIVSWSAEFKGEKFSGSGAQLSQELIDAINAADNEVLKLVAVLSDNDTGYEVSEAVYLIK